MPLTREKMLFISALDQCVSGNHGALKLYILALKILGAELFGHLKLIGLKISMRIQQIIQNFGWALGFPRLRFYTILLLKQVFHIVDGVVSLNLLEQVFLLLRFLTLLINLVTLTSSVTKKQPLSFTINHCLVLPCWISKNLWHMKRKVSNIPKLNSASGKS